jgi:hypothetical protein
MSSSALAGGLSKTARIVLAVLNFLNAAFPGVSSVFLLTSPRRIEVEWGIFMALAAAGMIGLGICLLVYPSQARTAAVVAVLLVTLNGVIVFPIGASDHDDTMDGRLLIFFGVIESAVIAIIPVITLFATLVRKP